MIPKGTYKAKATSATWATSKQKGTTYVRVVFRVDGGEYDGTSVPWDGYFTDKTESRTIESLQACGCTFPGGDVTNNEGIDTNLVDIVISHESWVDERSGEEKTRARVDWVNGGGGIPEEQQMSASQKATFAARMKGKIVAMAKKPTTSPNGAGRKPPTQNDEQYTSGGDDIPF